MTDPQIESLEPIAERTFEVDGSPCFHVRVFKPFLDQDGETWWCYYALEGPETKNVSRSGGVDSMQALVNALYVLSAAVETSAEYLSRRLTLDGRSEDLGLPRLPVPEDLATTVSNG